MTLTYRIPKGLALTHGELDGNFTDLDGRVQALGANVKTFGAVGNGVANDTAAVQAAINAVRDAGGGVVYMPKGTYSLGASVDSSIFSNELGNKAATTGCLVLWSGIYLVGDGPETTILKPTSKQLSCIFHISPTSGGIEGLTIDAGWVATDAEDQGHGIFTMDQSTAGAHKVFKNVTYRNLTIKSVAAYGIGLQGTPDIENVLFDNITVSVTGRDGIDIKYRGPTPMCRGCRMTNIRVHSPGKDIVDQAGIDVRGPWHLTNIYVTDVGTVGFQVSGVRFRSYLGATLPGMPGFQADYASLTNAMVECNASGTPHGISIASADVRVNNATIIGGARGVSISGNAFGNPDNATVNNTTTINTTEYGFYVGGVVSRAALSNCVAVNATTAGFRNEGVSTLFTGCSTRNTTTAFSGSAGAIADMVCMGCCFPGANFLSQSSTSGIAELKAIGADTDVDLRLLPKGAGNVRFGTFTSSGAVSVNGSITIKDAGGTVRKLATIA